MASFGKSFGASFARVTSSAIGYAELTLTAAGVAHFESPAVVEPPVVAPPKVGGGVPVIVIFPPKPKRAQCYAELVITCNGRAHFEQPKLAGIRGRGSVNLYVAARAKAAYVNVDRDDEEFFALAA